MKACNRASDRGLSRAGFPYQGDARSTSHSKTNTVCRNHDLTARAMLNPDLIDYEERLLVPAVSRPDHSQRDRFYGRGVSPVEATDDVLVNHGDSAAASQLGTCRCFAGSEAQTHSPPGAYQC